MSSYTQSYELKNNEYFSGQRRDFVDRLEKNSSRAILEIGCGDGSTGLYAKNQGKCSLYVGVELFPLAAESAAKVVDRVYTANIESFDPPEPAQSFDVLIASEVLEHLVDPWAVLKRLRPLLRPGALVFASSPNVGHYSVIWMLLNGRWDLETWAEWIEPICVGSRLARTRGCSKIAGLKLYPLNRLASRGPVRGLSML